MRGATWQRWDRGIQLTRLGSMKPRISTKSNPKSMEKYAHDCKISVKQHQIRFVFSCLVFLVFFCCTVLFPKANRATRLKQIGANAWRWKKHGGSRISVWYWKSAMPVLRPCPRECWSSRPWFLGDVFIVDSCHAAPRCLPRVSALRPNFTMLSWRRHCERVPPLPRANEVCTL